MCGKLEGDSPDDEHLFRFGYALPTHLLLPEHKATYWAITDDEARLEGYERATAPIQRAVRHGRQAVLAGARSP